MTIFLLALAAVLLVFAVFFSLMYRRSLVKVRSLEAEVDVQKLKNQACRDHISKLKEECNNGLVLSQLVLQSPNAVMLMDAEANILSLNEGFEKMYEYDFDSFTKVLGTNYRQTSFNADVENRIQWVFENKQPYRYEALNVTRSGREIWTQTALMPLLNEDGEVSHLATVDTDIHERVVKSDKMLQELEELNKKIDELTKQYRYLEKEAENLFVSITELYSLIENTNTILTFIRSISDETRILGFNASIEASRAGEYGKGFRVITNQIVEISQSTIESVAKIGNIVNSITNKQDELLARKDGSLNQMKEYNHIVSELKQVVRDVEQSVIEFKSIA